MPHQYWDIEREIVERQEPDVWRSGVIEKVAKDIQNEFLGIEGFSKTNMGRIRAFYWAYLIYPQAVGKLEALLTCKIPWGHNIPIFEGGKSFDQRLGTPGSFLRNLYALDWEKGE